MYILCCRLVRKAFFNGRESILSLIRPTLLWSVKSVAYFAFGVSL